MHRVARDDMTGHVEFLQQLFHGGDFVGFLVDLNMRQHERRIDGKRVEHLFRLDVIEVIETALERLAIERHDTRAGTQANEIRLTSGARDRSTESVTDSNPRVLS